jgi:hypothetical protein
MRRRSGVYRSDILQPLVVALFLFQIGTGLFFGVYLAFYVLGIPHAGLGGWPRTGAALSRPLSCGCCATRGGVARSLGINESATIAAHHGADQSTRWYATHHVV